MKTAETVDAIVRSTVEGLGFELCDVEFAKEAGNWVLTLYVDREGGVTIDDCEAVIIEKIFKVVSICCPEFQVRKAFISQNINIHLL